jgi:hypothetical protein
MKKSVWNQPTSTVFICIKGQSLWGKRMPPFRFIIIEDGREIADEEGQELLETEAAGSWWKPALQSLGMHSSGEAPLRSS